MKCPSRWCACLLATALFVACNPDAPEIATHDPVENEKTDDATGKDDDSTEKPDDATGKDDDSTEKPDDATGKTDDSTGKDDDATGKDDDSTENPDDATGKDDDSTEKPDDATGKDDDSTEKPDDSTGKTDDATGKDDDASEETCVLPEPVAIDAAGMTNFYQISCALYRSGQPSTGGFNASQALGIQSVISLQILNFDEILEKSEQSGLAIYHVPMSPYSVTEQNVIDALKNIRDAPKPIVVHCLHGSDRTGTVVAFYRILFENWTKDAAKAEMQEARFGFHEEFTNLLELIDNADIDAMRVALEQP